VRANPSGWNGWLEKQLICAYVITQFLNFLKNNKKYVTPDIAVALKIFLELWKKNKFLASCSLRKKILFKESPPSIMFTRNPNWSTEILWFGTGYVKGKILTPLKHPAWGRLHCWFCLKLLNIYSLMLWWFVYNIPDSGASEYLTTDTSNSGVDRYYVTM